MIRIITKGVTHIKHHQPLLFMSCNLLDITAKDGRIVKGLFITVNSPTSSKRFAKVIFRERQCLKINKIKP